MQSIPEAVTAWLVENGYGAPVGVRAVGGGCINNGARLETASGKSFFLKTNPHAPADMFAREAEGLAELRAHAGLDGEDGLSIPEPFLIGADFLLLEDLAPAARCGDYWTLFGYGLARLHLATRPQFGFAHDNYIGATPQANPWMQDGYEFFAQQRLIAQAGLARGRGLLPAGDVRRVERLAERLPDLIPEQPASLVHGDLWSGNALSDASGGPAIIDPAAYYGWAEADLAMTDLFGTFPPAFYRAYEEVRPLADGYRRRFPIYNLYHLLNHLNLFGGGYRGQVQAILERYAG